MIAIKNSSTAVTERGGASCAAPASRERRSAHRGRCVTLPTGGKQPQSDVVLIPETRQHVPASLLKRFS